MKIPKIKLVLAFIGFTLIAALIILMTIDTLGGGNFKVVNNTGKNITNLDVSVVDEGTFDMCLLYSGPVGAGETVKADFDKVIKVTSDNTGEIFMGIKFEGYDESIGIIDGYISKDFSGNFVMNIFETEDGELRMTADMGTTLFGSTEHTNIDEETVYILMPDEADYDYVD